MSFDLRDSKGCRVGRWFRLPTNGKLSVNCRFMIIILCDVFPVILITDSKRDKNQICYSVLYLINVLKGTLCFRSHKEDCFFFLHNLLSCSTNTKIGKKKKINCHNETSSYETACGVWMSVLIYTRSERHWCKHR